MPHRFPIAVHSAVALTLVVAATACSSGSAGTGGTTGTTQPTVATVSVRPTTSSIVAGTTVQLTATPEDATGNVVSGAGVTWHSSSATTASVSSEGLVTGLTPGGPVTITATTNGVTGTAAITVTAVPVAAVTVTPNTGMVDVGSMLQLAAATRDAAGNPLVGRALSWASTDPATASVSSTGLVTGLAAGGPVTITAVSEGITGNATVLVEPAPVAAIAVDPTPAIVFAGATLQLSAALTDAHGNVLAGQSVAWNTDNPSVATVSSTGLVTGVSPGGPIAISATSSAIIGSASVTVIPVPVASVTVHAGASVVEVGKQLLLTPAVLDSAGHALFGRAVTWTSDKPALATVSSAGLITGVAAGGPVTFTATCDGVSGHTTVTVAMGWDLSVNWSDSKNPNGVWSYNEGSNPLPHVSSWSTGFGTTQPAWARSAEFDGTHDFIPAWMKTRSPFSNVDGPADYVVGDVVVHTTDDGNGIGNGDANVSWTSPMTGTVSIQGGVWEARDIGRSNDWALLVNGVPVTGGTIAAGDPYNSKSPFAFDAGSGGPGAVTNLAVSVGDVITLVLTRDVQYGDLVGVRLHLTGLLP